MKIGRTILTCLSILITAVLSYIIVKNMLPLSVSIGKASGTAISSGMLVYLIVDLVIPVTFCLSIWFMLVWNAGDKIPPVFMLLVGILGLVIHALNILTDLRWNSMFWITSFSNPFAYTLNALFIMFGIAGLLTKRNPK